MAQSMVQPNIYRSTVLLKAVMGATGVIMFGWLIAHMGGNLKIFFGAEALNDYAKFLHDSPGIIWTGRLVTLGAIALHILSALRLTQINRAARPTAYQHGAKRNRTTYAARTMIMSGPIISLYLLFHLAHLTFGVTIASYDKSDVYNNIVSSFQNPLLAIIYITANVLVGIHLYHGAWSFFQSLGLNHPKYNTLRRTFATGLSVTITLGFISVPIAVLTGIVS